MNNYSMKKKNTGDDINGSFTLSESSDEKLQGSFCFNKIGENKVFSLERVLKYTACFSLVLGVYGFEFQKGMIERMGLENVGFNYEIKEIYHFAFLGIMGIVNRFLQLEILPKTESIIYMVLIYVFAGLIIYIINPKHKVWSWAEKIKFRIKLAPRNGFFFKVRSEILPNPDNKNWLWIRRNIFLIKNNGDEYDNFFLRVSSKLIPSVFFWSCVGFLASLIYQVLIKYVFAIFWIILSIPVVVGYLNGVHHIENLSSKYCEEPVLNKAYDSGVDLCPMLTIKGQKIWGEIVLLTNDAYFIRKESYFAYVTKNGDNCAFSHYSKKDEKSTFTLDPDIQSLCFNKTDVAKLKKS